jgi:hypothetical protein
MAKKAGNEMQKGKKGYLVHKGGVAPGEGFDVSIEQSMGGLPYDGFEAGEFNDKNPDGPDWPSSAKGKAE